MKHRPKRSEYLGEKISELLLGTTSYSGEMAPVPIPCVPPPVGYVEQVRSRYVAGDLDVGELEDDLWAALLLEDGQLIHRDLVPKYLRDPSGYYLAAPRELYGLV